MKIEDAPSFDDMMFSTNYGYDKYHTFSFEDVLRLQRLAWDKCNKLWVNAINNSCLKPERDCINELNKEDKS